MHRVQQTNRKNNNVCTKAKTLTTFGEMDQSSNMNNSVSSTIELF